jgi:hypothetical protein
MDWKRIGKWATGTVAGGCFAVIVGGTSGPSLGTDAFAAGVEKDTPVNYGCLGACGNTKTSAEGWCGNCASHCPGGTEAECTASCGQPWDEGPCMRDAAHKVEEAYKNCKGNKPCEGWAGGDYRHGLESACHGTRDAQNAKRQGCLDACGAQKDCRETWCKGDGPARRQCYGEVDSAWKGCENVCRNGKPACVDEHCAGVAMIATCDGEKRVTGFCASLSFHF